MSDFDIRADPVPAGERRLVPMQVGSAVVYVEAVGEDATIEGTQEFGVVGLNPAEAFEKASDALRECVRIVGDRLERLGDATRPEEVGVEFTITFDVEGQAHIIPVLLTGKSKASMGIKVTAKWQRGATR
jgi:hypothetical protein